MEHIWTIEFWLKNLDYNDKSIKRGIRIAFSKDVDAELRRECKKFIAWVRKTYFFPTEITVHLSNKKNRKAVIDPVYSCFGSTDYTAKQHAYICTDDYGLLCQKHGKDEACNRVIHRIAKEITHYFQWINSLEYTPKGSKRQATQYADIVLDDYKYFSEAGGHQKHLWLNINWIENLKDNKYSNRTGLRLNFDDGVDPEVKRACKKFCAWLRTRYYFPLRVPIYFKNKDKIRTMDGDYVYGTFFAPNLKYQEPYIRVAVGDYQELLKHNEKDEALYYTLKTTAHEISHYYQWINGIEKNNRGLEWQASWYAKNVVWDYLDEVEHP